MINPGPVIHSFPMPIKTGILGDQGFLASFLENAECDSQAKHLVCSEEG